MIHTDTRTITRTLAGLRDKVPLILQQGGSSCFAPGTLIVCEDGNKPIESVIIGEKVLSYDEKSKELEYKPVVKVLKFDNTKKTVSIKLKNGQTIIATEDHKFFYNGEWVELGKIILEYESRNLGADTEFQSL